MTTQASDTTTRSGAFTVDSVTSTDGTTIGYRHYGAGPAVVLVNGATGTTHSYHELATRLASDFTVCVPERRGRPLSPHPYTPDHVIERDVEDLAAVLERTGAHRLFGLSSGAIVALEAARVLPSVHQLALYEPPLYVPPQHMRFDLVARFNAEVDAGHTAAAMTSALIAAGTLPPLFTFLPRAIVRLLIACFLYLDDRRKARVYPSLRELVPTMQYDFKDVSSMQDRFDTFRSVTSDVLLMSSTGSAAYLREACGALARVLPRSQRTELGGLDHSGPWNADLGGRPGAVAAALQAFFGRASPRDNGTDTHAIP